MVRVPWLAQRVAVGVILAQHCENTNTRNNDPPFQWVIEKNSEGFDPENRRGPSHQCIGAQ